MNKQNFDNIKMHGTNVKKKKEKMFVMCSVFNEMQENNLCRRVQCLYFRNNAFLCVVLYCISSVNIKPVWFVKKKKKSQ